MNNQQHTPEPWAVNDQTGNGWMDNSIYICSDKGENIVRCYNDFKNAEANARRIVACVNACAGIPTDVLEKGRMSSDAFVLEESRADKAEKQRDDMLAALEKIAKHYEDKCGLDATPSKRAEAWRLDYHNVKGIAINAIAGVKGGA